MDEPFQNLDIYWVLKTIELIKKIGPKQRTVVVAAQRFEEAISSAANIICLHGGKSSFRGPPCGDEFKAAIKEDIFCTEVS